MRPAWIILASLGMSGSGLAQAPSRLAALPQAHVRTAAFTFFRVAESNAGPRARGICITPVRFRPVAAVRGGAEANQRDQVRGNGPSPLPICGPPPGVIQPV